MTEKQTATYQRLQAILVDEGCPICRLNQEAVTTYLDTLLWESSTDLNVHQLLSASLGFCGRHSRDLLTFGGQRLAVALVERASLLAAIHRLSELATPHREPAASFQLWQRRKKQPTGPQRHARLPRGIKPCPACEREASEEGRGTSVLLANLEELAGRLEAAGGLCLPHFVLVLQAASPAERDTLLAVEQRVWTNLAAHLEEFIRKHMDHYHDQPISEPARVSVERAIAVLTGEYPVR